MYFIKDIKRDELFGEHQWLLDKICEIIFTNRYNSFSQIFSRELLDSVQKYGKITMKQASIIRKLKPK